MSLSSGNATCVYIPPCLNNFAPALNKWDHSAIGEFGGYSRKHAFNQKIPRSLFEELVVSPILQRAGASVHEICNVTLNAGTKRNFDGLVDFKKQHKPSQINSYPVEVEKNWWIYVEESGNPDGIPVVFVHGGPGARFKVTDHQWFDPEKYRIIVFQQRGTHGCIPSAEDFSVHSIHFKDIGIETLAKDMEVLRDHLGISNWLVFGGSWGSTLGLYYAQEYPKSCTGLILRGIFLASRKELCDFYLPEKIDEKVPHWNVTALKSLENYARERGFDPTAEKMTTNYRKMIVEENDHKAARLWRAFEKYIEGDEAQLQRIVNDESETTIDERSTGIWETQLFSQMIEKIDLMEDARLQNLADIPIKIVQGNKDTICPPKIAEELVKKLRTVNKSVDFSMVKDGQHSPYSHPGMVDALVRATDHFASHIRIPELSVTSQKSHGVWP